MAMPFAIRDDDTSYWTSPCQLEDVYRTIWGSCPVSLAVIPFAVEPHCPGDWNAFCQGERMSPLGENNALTDFLKEMIGQGKVSIMLHGFSHQYTVSLGKKQRRGPATKPALDAIRKKSNKPLYWHGEYAWKNYEQLRKETAEGKQYLEDTLAVRINTFVPPSNDISAAGARAVAECGLNISGTMRLSKFNRSVTGRSMKNWLLKLAWRVRHNKVYPRVMEYGTHRELCAYGLVHGVTSHDLRKALHFCSDNRAPFVLATHYWEIAKHPAIKDVLHDVVRWVRSADNANPGSVDRLF